MNPNSESFTKYGWFVCLWVLVIAFQYGYHISVLNQIQLVLTCRANDSVSFPFHQYALSSCIPMSDFTFSLVTSIFTVGGLAGSLVANLIMDSWGRKGATRICAALSAVGVGLMGISDSPTSLGFGRFLVGVASGVGLCVGPIFLAEIAPSKISGNVGVLTQLGIVLGIMLTQIAGFVFATSTGWRIVLYLSCALSVSHFISSALIVESPAWLAAKGRLDEKKTSMRRLWGRNVMLPASPVNELEDPLLSSGAAVQDDMLEAITVPQLFKSQDLRKPLAVVCFAMLSQQVSGINAVLYYSNDILAKSLPSFGPYVSLGITVVNVLMTFPPIILIERVGRRSLLTWSTFGALISLLSVGFGLNVGLTTLSSVAIITFVMSFAIGLGPIPFVMIPEVSPPHAVSALSSVALSLNWVVNFMVGLTFLPLRNLMAGGDASKEGRVFYVFVGILFASTYSLSRLYRG